MGLLAVGQVIWIYDGTISPAGYKMVACVEPDQGFFYRINTKGHWRPAVRMPKAEHQFLDHDSHLECGDPLEIDDYLIEEGLRERGVIGSLSASVCRSVEAVLDQARTLSPADKAAIRGALALIV
jgi:hypothetical protein